MKVKANIKYCRECRAFHSYLLSEDSGDGKEGWKSCSFCYKSNGIKIFMSKTVLQSKVKDIDLKYFEHEHTEFNCPYILEMMCDAEQGHMQKV